MRTSHRNIHKMINDAKSKVRDKELFTSNAFVGYLEDIAEVVSKRYKRPIQIKLIYDKKNELVACTDNQVININVANKYTMNFGSRSLKANSIIGLLGHELGHVNFTDFYLAGIFNSKLEKGMFYPGEPTFENSEEEFALHEIKEILRSKDSLGMNVIMKVLHSFNNILEDAYIEAKMCSEFPGTIKKCIIMQRTMFIDNTLSIIEQINKKYDNLSIIINLILNYATASRVNNDGGYKGELLDKLNECIVHIDRAICCDDIRVRFKSSLQLLLKVWKYVKEIIEKERNKGQQQSQGQGNTSKNASGNSQQGNDNGLDGQVPNMGSDPKGNSMAVNNAQNVQKASDENNSTLEIAKDEIKKVVEEELGRLALKHTTSISRNKGSGNVKKENNFVGSEYDNSASDIERVLNKVATEKVCTKEEKKLANEMQNSLSQISYGEIHKGVDKTIHRINPIPDYLKSSYMKISPPLLLLSKKLQKGIKNVIKDRKFGGKMNGLYMGKRLEPRSIVRDDGRYFYKRNLPDDTMDIAVAVLVDESGSMSSCDRITIARATSLIMYDFCQSLEIPISIVGHTERHGEVYLYSYADYDSIDGNDKYRIMDMSSRGCNRDGAALRYVAEQLVKRPEKVKLLIIISDGQPSAKGYHGTAAEEDLRQIKSEYTKKGITLFAAAIGDDKENIERIYKDGFLDITDLEKMPVNLVKLIMRYVK